jgi:hypothetical protein
MVLFITYLRPSLQKIKIKKIKAKSTKQTLSRPIDWPLFLNFRQHHYCHHHRSDRNNFGILHLGALGLFEAGGSQSCYGRCDGGDSSDVDENLEKVASQLALTAFAWWTWP